MVTTRVMTVAAFVGCLALAACGTTEQTSTTPSATSSAAASSASPSATPSPALSDAAAADLIGTWSTAVTEAQSVTSEQTQTQSGQTSRTLTSRIQFTPQAAAIDEVTPGATVHTIAVDGQVYRQDPSTAPKWVGVLRAGAQPLVEEASGLTILRVMHEAVTQVQPAGAESVGGQDTQRYAVIVDAGRAWQAQGDEWVGAPRDFTYTVWVDDAGRPVQIRGSVNDVDIAMSFTWNVPVTVTAPTDLAG